MSETTLPPPPQWTPATPAPPPAPKVPFHARVVRIWWAIGVALACLVVGAGTGSLITHLAERNGSPARFQQVPGGFGQNGFGRGFGRNGFPGQGFGFRGPNGFQGQPGQGQQGQGQTAPNVVPPNNGS
jgi:hypothetical protein